MSEREPSALLLQGMALSVDDILAYRIRAQPRPIAFVRFRDGTHLQCWDGNADQVRAWLAREALRARQRPHDA